MTVICTYPSLYYANYNDFECHSVNRPPQYNSQLDYTYTSVTSIVAQGQRSTKQIHAAMDVPVLELQRVGCKSVELSIDEITTDSVARAFKVL